VLSVDLHAVFRNTRDIDNTLRTFVLRAAASGESRAEIICGKGEGKLRTRVLTYLRQPQVARLVKGADVDPDNDGRIVLRF
jgi:DNA-nicking Smr family endonuclease